jgi:tRNA dimethylallyltransferase
MEFGGRNKIIVILGPTASGKSDVAIKLAQKFNGEIISADSRQIYRGMDIGTGKVTSAEQKMATHHMLDVADPNDEFNISHFKKLAEKMIEDILKRGKLPIICGGTGFWIKSIVDNVHLPEVKPDKELRNMLRNKSAEELFEMLEKLDIERAEDIDAKNKVRLIRAIEICKALGSVPKIKTTNKKLKTNFEFLQIGIDVPR